MKKLLMLAATAALLNANAQNPRLFPFNSDATTGISTNKTYTHTYNFGVSSGTLTINGVVFTNTTAANNTGIPQGWRNFPPDNASGSESHIATPSGQIRELLRSLNFNRASGTMVVTGMEQGKVYEIRFYNRAWGEGADRTQTITFRPDSATADKIVFNPDAAPKTDQVLAYRYTAQASGELGIELNAKISGNTFHVYGFSNELVWEVEAQPAALVGDTFATFNGNVITPGVATTVTVQIKVDDNDGSEASWQGCIVATAGVFNASGPFSFTLPANTLQPQTAYAFRLVWTDGAKMLATSAQTFETRGVTPVLATPHVDEIGFDEAEVSGELSYAGATGFADVTLFWGESENAWTGQLELGAKQAGGLEGTVSPLLYATDYFFAFRATNATHEAWSEAVKFRTKGEAVLGAPNAVCFPQSVKLII